MPATAKGGRYPSPVQFNRQLTPGNEASRHKLPNGRGQNAGTLKTLGHYGTLGIKDVIVTFSYPDCLSSSAVARASFGVLKLSA
jgi:hypothetical protein